MFNIIVDNFKTYIGSKCLSEIADIKQEFSFVESKLREMDYLRDKRFESSTIKNDIF